MITNSTIGKAGRLGNQLFQVAFLLAQGIKRGVHVAWPHWGNAKYFQGDFQPTAIREIPKTTEPNFHYDPDFLNGLDWAKDINFHGYFQSAKYWQGQEEQIRAAFRFEQSVTERVRAKNAAIFERPTIAVHVRRGDYVGHPCYTNLSPTHYLSALEKYFPNWREENNLVIFSDNSDYARIHFGCFANAYFADGSEIEDLCLMAMCNSFIIANSSFSWWGAYLSGSKKVIRPARHFEGPLSGHDTKDLYPPEWLAHDTERLDLRDTTFMIPVAFDHPDRVNNLNLILQSLICSFNTNIIVCEQGGDYFRETAQWCEYMRFDSPVFHRTKMLNLMAERAETHYIVNYDADVLLSPSQVLEAVHRLRNDADVIYPYNGRFVRLARNIWYNRIEQSLDVGETAGVIFPPKRRGDLESKGGCVFHNRTAYFEAGGENENFVSFGHEDEERYHRFKTLGYDVQRLSACLYHMEHWCGPDSSTRNPHYVRNAQEWQRVRAMTGEELKEYIRKWPWSFVDTLEMLNLHGI